MPSQPCRSALRKELCVLLGAQFLGSIQGEPRSQAIAAQPDTERQARLKTSVRLGTKQLPCLKLHLRLSFP